MCLLFIFTVRLVDPFCIAKLVGNYFSDKMPLCVKCIASTMAFVVRMAVGLQFATSSTFFIEKFSNGASDSIVVSDFCQGHCTGANELSHRLKTLPLLIIIIIDDLIRCKRTFSSIEKRQMCIEIEMNSSEIYV